MTNPLDGDFQRLLLHSTHNGRVKTQQQRAEEASTIPSIKSTLRKHDGKRPLRERPGPVVGQSRITKNGPIIATSSLGPHLLSFSQSAVMLPSAWSSGKNAAMVIKPIPSSVNPWDVSKFFSRFGNVVLVELDSPLRSNYRSAKIRFEPPPTDLSFFQEGKCRHNLGGSWSWAEVELITPHRKEPSLTTPLGNTCPASISLQLQRLTFGLQTRPATFMPKREINPSGSPLELKLTADFRRQMLTIYFPCHISGERQYYRLDMKFGIIQGIHKTTTRSGCSGLFIGLKGPPSLRKKQTNSSGTAWTDRLVWGEDELWHRAVEVKSGSQTPLTQPISLDEKVKLIDIGRWTTYLLDLEKSAKNQWLIVEAYLHEWNIFTNVNVEFAQIPSKDPELWEILSDPSSEKPGSLPWNDDFALLSSSAHISLPFDVRYQLEVCISRGILSEYNIGREWLEKLSSLSGSANRGVASRARLILEYAADQGRPLHDPLELFKDHGAMTYYPATLQIPNYCALIRRAIVTPTRIYFSTPTVETSNRVVRRYQHIQDHFLRVQFTDELLDGRIRACEVDRDDELYARVCRVMTQGIRMGKWHWKFLAFGNSQIRESAAFFFCEPEDGSVTCDSIRQWMGNFDHITSVAKLAARLGQCFSTTRLLHYLSSPRVTRIPDVVSENGFCFTDGIGKISLPLACLIAEDWKLDRPPSAVQFRMGGCKGVLVQWPDVKGTEIHIRPSQEKFCSEYNGLEIIRCSQFSCATLNRQTILILSCLGVPDEVFIDMMASQIANIDAALTDENTAIKLLDNYVDENLTTITISSMLRSGFMHTREPFVRTVLQLWRSWSIKALKEKARLVVEQSAFVLGCVDETGTLRGYSRAIEGQGSVSRDQLPQIFLQVPDRGHRHAYKVVTGLCIVGRNPSLHPGDIRVVEAVDVPQLRHLRDVVVFPLQGDRDVPSMCSGGDLDGDDYFVIWDPRLLPAEWAHPPMNYSAPKPPVESRTSLAKSLAFFFVLFMKNDRLPLIAHAHLATADYEPEGAKHWKC